MLGLVGVRDRGLNNDSFIHRSVVSRPGVLVLQRMGPEVRVGYFSGRAVRILA